MEYVWIGMTLRPEGSRNFSKLVLSPLMIDFWMEVCHILMIFPYFSWKSRRSSAKDSGLNTNTILEGALFIYALRNTNIVGILFFYDQICRCLGDYGHCVSKVWCKLSKVKVCFWRLWIKKWQKHKICVSKMYRP